MLVTERGSLLFGCTTCPMQVTRLFLLLAEGHCNWPNVQKLHLDSGCISAAGIAQLHHASVLCSCSLYSHRQPYRFSLLKRGRGLSWLDVKRWIYTYQRKSYFSYKSRILATWLSLGNSVDETAYTVCWCRRWRKLRIQHTVNDFIKPSTYGELSCCDTYSWNDV